MAAFVGVAIAAYVGNEIINEVRDQTGPDTNGVDNTRNQAQTNESRQEGSQQNNKPANPGTEIDDIMKGHGLEGGRDGFAGLAGLDGKGAIKTPGEAADDLIGAGISSGEIEKVAGAYGKNQEYLGGLDRKGNVNTPGERAAHLGATAGEMKKREEERDENEDNRDEDDK